MIAARDIQSKKGWKYLVSHSSPMTIGRVWDMASFFLNGLGLSLGVNKTRIDQWQAFTFFNSIQVFFQAEGGGGEMRRILHEPVGGTRQKACL